MDNWQATMLSLVSSDREHLVDVAADVACASCDAPRPRREAERTIRAWLAVLEEGLRGTSDEVRSGLLLELRAMVRTTTWQATLDLGMACWSVLVGHLVCGVAAIDQGDAVVWFARFSGRWWNDLSRTLLPAFIEENRL